MSWKCSTRYVALGPLEYHVWVDARDDYRHSRKHYEIALWGRTLTLWPR